jgi:hypothetical protein
MVDLSNARTIIILHTPYDILHLFSLSYNQMHVLYFAFVLTVHLHNS